jgi:hypothetical protein
MLSNYATKLVRLCMILKALDAAYELACEQKDCMLDRITVQFEENCLAIINGYQPENS